MLFDYTTVTARSIGAALDAALAKADDFIAEMVDCQDPRTFANTLEPAERAAQTVANAYGQGPFLGETSPDEEVRTAARALEEKLAKWGVDLVFREDVYQAIAEYAATDEAASLAGESARLLEFTLRDFRMAGHELALDEREKLKELNERLVELSIAFSTNIAEYEDYLVVTRADLDGLPDSYIEGLKPGEKENTFCVSMDYPDVVPFIENVKNRDLREALQKKFSNRAAEANRPVIQEAVEIRQQIADIFEVDSWAHHSMQLKMAKTPEAVFAFYDSIIPGLTTQARAEIKRMASLLHADTGADELELWDWRYYDTVLKRDEFGVDNQRVSEYLSLNRVVKGMFDLTSEMFGVTYTEVSPANAWHEDVTLWQVTEADSGHTIGHFYMDLFPREGKFSHAAAWPLVPAHRGPDGYVKPVSAIVANFPKPSPGRPSLLQHGDAVTLFHEFGHILHMTFSKAELLRFSGASTEWDFVEAPSQIMEHWCWEPAILRRFATHHETNEVMPDELLEQLAASRYLNESLAKLRQVTYGMLDMYLHGPGRPYSLDEALRKANEFSLLPHPEGTFFLGSFGHMFGYDAGYYGYLWAEVFGDDMFSRFVADGIDNPAVGLDYRNLVLAPNGTKDAIELVRQFLGREPSSEPFLTKLGIEQDAP